MRALNILLFILVIAFSSASKAQPPDLTRKEDLKALGVGKIVEKDGSIIKSVVLHEVREYWVVYIKRGSMHDLMMERVNWIEFSESKWGPLKIEFSNGKPIFSKRF